MFNDRKNRLTSPYQKQVVFDLPMGQKIERGAVVIKGTVTLAGGAAGTVLGEGAPTNLVTRVFVRANPANTRYSGGEIVKCGARSLLRYSQLQHNGKFIAEQAGSVMGNGAAAAYAIYISYPIYFSDPTLRYHDFTTALNTDAGSYESVQVEVDLDTTLLQSISGYAGTMDTSQLQVQWVDKRAQAAGDTHTVFQEDHTVLIGAAQDRMLDNAMPRDGAFLHWLMMAQAGATFTLADTILNKLVLRGSTVDYKLYAKDIRQEMYDDEWLDPGVAGAGLYFVDWTNGFLQNSLIASTLQAEFDVNNPSGANADSLLIFTRRLFAPAPASK